MEIETTLRLEQPQFPQDYRPALVSFLKRTTQQADPALYAQLYESDPKYLKPFTFSVWLPEPKYLGSVIALEQPNLKISFCTGDTPFGISLYNALLRAKGHAFPLAGQNSMTVTHLRLFNQQPVTKRQVPIKFLSPLVCRHHTVGEPDHYFTSEEEGFADALRKTVTTQLQRLCGLPSEVCVVHLKPLHARRTVVCAFGCAFGCTLGSFLLEGEPEVLNLLRAYGMGSRRAEGFGLFHMAGE